MARNKYPEITEKRILESAEKLFLEKGYENTTIQDIVDDLGDLSKGAIYHHFKSKEDIIEAVTTSKYASIDFAEYLKDEPTGLAKLQKLVLFCLTDTAQQELLAAAPTLMMNPKMLSMELKSIQTEIAPMVLPFIEEGIQDGSITTEYPRQAAEVFLILSNIWINPLVFSVEEEEFVNKILFYKELFEGIGMPVVTDEVVQNMKRYHRFIETPIIK